MTKKTTFGLSFFAILIFCNAAIAQYTWEKANDKCTIIKAGKPIPLKQSLR
jgi:hypothetical protein